MLVVGLLGVGEGGDWGRRGGEEGTYRVEEGSKGSVASGTSLGGGGSLLLGGLGKINCW